MPRTRCSSASSSTLGLALGFSLVGGGLGGRFGGLGLGGRLALGLLGLLGVGLLRLRLLLGLGRRGDLVAHGGLDGGFEDRLLVRLGLGDPQGPLGTGLALVLLPVAGD